MSIARSGAGAGGTQYGVLTSVNQGGGSKKQGLVSTTNTRVDLNAFIRVRGGGHNRNWLFCMNQLGGVGRRWGQASGPGNRGGVSANCQRLAYRRRQQYPPKPCGAQVRGWGAGVKFPALCKTNSAAVPLIFMAQGNNVVACSQVDGHVVWALTACGATPCSPLLPPALSEDGTKLFVVSGDGYVWAFEPQTGKQIWFLALADVAGTPSCEGDYFPDTGLCVSASPVAGRVAGRGVLYVTWAGGTVFEVDTTKGGIARAWMDPGSQFVPPHPGTAGSGIIKTASAAPVLVAEKGESPFLVLMSAWGVPATSTDAAQSGPYFRSPSIINLQDVTKPRVQNQFNTLCGCGTGGCDDCDENCDKSTTAGGGPLCYACIYGVCGTSVPFSATSKGLIDAQHGGGQCPEEYQDLEDGVWDAPCRPPATAAEAGAKLQWEYACFNVAALVEVGAPLGDYSRSYAVYVASPDSKIYKIPLKSTVAVDGSTSWDWTNAQDVPDWITMVSGSEGQLPSAPILGDTVIYVAAAENRDYLGGGGLHGNVWALNKTDGSVRWVFSAPDRAYDDLQTFLHSPLLSSDKSLLFVLCLDINSGVISSIAISTGEGGGADGGSVAWRGDVLGTADAEYAVGAAWPLQLSSDGNTIIACVSSGAEAPDESTLIGIDPANGKTRWTQHHIPGGPPAGCFNSYRGPETPPPIWAPAR